MVETLAARTCVTSVPVSALQIRNVPSSLTVAIRLSSRVQTMSLTGPAWPRVVYTTLRLSLHPIPVPVHLYLMCLTVVHRATNSRL